MQAALPAEVPVDRPVVQHTPGPWKWFERMPGRPYLATPDRGHLYVMGFERQGMQGAGPFFAHWPGIESGAARERKVGVMEPGLFLCDGSIHPDARVIEAAPDMLASLLAYDRWADAVVCRDPELEAIRRQMRAAIAKANGG